MAVGREIRFADCLPSARHSAIPPFRHSAIPPVLSMPALFRPVRLVRLLARPPSAYPHLPHPHCAHVMQPELRMTGPEHSGQTLIL